ncbi:MAG: hypothetical protein HYX63_03905 [Gammaproteobacteria bacterium]|nr:hypothetical protein [Gammaproteobacteria bacterium]
MPDGLAALTLVSKFLTRDVLPVIPRALTAELRATIKLLDTARDELDALYPRLLDECRELLALDGDAHVLLHDLAASFDPTPLTSLTQRVARGSTDLTALMACHRELLEVTAAAFLSLQQLDREAQKNRTDVPAMLRRFCAVLGRHAETRLPWQAVFPWHSA